MGVRLLWNGRTWHAGKVSLRRRDARSVLALSASLGIALAVFQSGCGVDPEQPEYTNPFDPLNPITHGDPFQLEVSNTPEGVRLDWNLVPATVIDGYRLYRGVMDSTNLGLIAELESDLDQYLDLDAPNASIVFYRVSATFPGGESAPQPEEALRIYTSPELSIEGDSSYTNHEAVVLSIEAPRAEWMWLSNSSDFADGQWQPFDPEPSWELPGADGQKAVYLKISYDDSSLSLPAYDQIILDRVAVILAFSVELPESPLGLCDWIGAALTTADTNGHAWLEFRSFSGVSLYPPAYLAQPEPGSYSGGWEVRWGEDASGISVEGHFADLANNAASPVIWGETFDLALGMVEVPAGAFNMGIDGYDPAEGPAHEVYLDQYWIDRYMVTNYQYAQFLSDGNSQYYSNMPQQKIQDVGSGQYQAMLGFEHFPVVMTLWSESQAYAVWAGKRLPTEAEWEKAARGTDAWVYPWGNSEPTTTQANYLFSGDPWEELLMPPESPCGYYNGRNYNGFQTTDTPGPYGNYDMAGNVWEWMADWFDPEYYASSPYENPQGPATGTLKVLRGGDCFSLPFFLRSHVRYDPWSMENRNSNVGFRCVRSYP